MKAISRARLTGGVLLSAVAFGLAATALGTAGSANASCASLNGHKIGQGCESNNGGVAVGIGHNAEAEAYGPGPAIAVAVGNPGPNPFYPQFGPTFPTKADARGTNSIAVAVGNGSRGGAWGTDSLGVVIGHGSNAFSYGGHDGNPPHPIFGHNNISITVANGAEARAVGNGRRSTAFTPGRHLNNGLNQ